MDPKFHRYLSSLRSYAGTVTVPGLDRPLQLPLNQIFVEPWVGQTEARRERAGTGPEEAGQPGLESATAADERQATAQRALDVLDRERRILILGEAGQGKSTLLRRYAIRLAENRGTLRLPLLVELGRKRERIDPSGLEWLRLRLPDAVSSKLDHTLWTGLAHQLRDGKLVILLDGFDELSHDAQSQLSEILRVLDHKNQVVLTSRPNAHYLDTLPGFACFELQQLQLIQTTDLAEKVCGALAAQRGLADHAPALQRLSQAARSAAGKMATNPLLLSFMAVSAIRRQEQDSLEHFPTHPVPLIDECLEALVAWQRDKPAAAWPLKLTHLAVLSILAPLALETFKTANGLISKRAVEDLDDQTRQYLLSYLLPARFVELRNGEYAFPHETFREYFAARAVVTGEDPFGVVKRHLHDPSWERVILYTAGCLDDTLRDLGGALPLWSAWVDLYIPTFSSVVVMIVAPLINIVGSVVGLFGNKVVGKVGKEITGELKEWSPDIQGFLRKWQARSRHSAEFFITAVLRRRSRFERILFRDRRLALRCLGQMSRCPNRLAIKLVNSAAEKEHPQNNQRTALLDALRDAASCPQVRAHLHDLTQPSHPSAVRARATESLQAVVFEKEVQDRLLQLMVDPDENVIAAAAVALRVVAAAPPVVGCMLELASSHSGPVRKGAILALGGAVSLPKVKAQLLKWANGTDGSDAVWALQDAVKDPDVHVHLMALLATSPDASVREAAVFLAKDSASTSADVRAALLTATHDPDRRVRRVALLALEDVATDQRVSNRLLEIVSEAPLIGHGPIEDYLLVGEAAGLLRRCYPSPEIRDRLLHLAHDDNITTRAGAAVALAAWASEAEVKSRLLALTRNRAAPVRAIAAKALREARSYPEVRNRLKGMTRDREASVRAAAHLALHEKTPAVKGQRLWPTRVLLGLGLAPLPWTMPFRQRLALLMVSVCAVYYLASGPPRTYAGVSFSLGVLLLLWGLLFMALRRQYRLESWYIAESLLAVEAPKKNEP
jgi:hypothetical protein